MSLVIAGSTVVDLIFPRVERLPAWPRHTESTPANLALLRDPPIVTLGGNGANAAYVAARCGVAVTLHTQIGDDALGGLARRWLADAGCRVATPARRAATAANVTVANARQERAIFFHPGVPFALPPRDHGPTATHLLVCGWPHPPPTMLARSFRAARARGAFSALDAGPILGEPWTLAALRPVFAALDLFLTNAYELRRIARAASLLAALARLRAVFPGHVVVKRGPDGALWLPAGSARAERVPSRRVRAVNTVGAGDSFNGALLAALVRGGTFPLALRSACATAASVVGSPRGVLGVRPAPLIRVHSQPKAQTHENLARHR